MSEEVRLREERVIWRTAAIAAAVAVAGVVVLYITSIEDLWAIHPRMQRVVEKIGDLVFVTGLLSVLWELFGRRVFLDEILAKTGVAREIRASGIKQVLPNFQAGIDWGKLFSDARKLDLLVSYARTWRNQHLDQLRQFASDEQKRIRVILPDPDYRPNLQTLSERYLVPAEEVQRRIQETIADFEELSEKNNVEIWLMKSPPIYTLYRFGATAVLSIYSHQVDRSPVPALLLERGGTLYEFASGDLMKLFTTPERCRRIYPSPP